MDPMGTRAQPPASASLTPRAVSECGADSQVPHGGPEEDQGFLCSPSGTSFLGGISVGIKDVGLLLGLA